MTRTSKRMASIQEKKEKGTKHECKRNKQVIAFAFFPHVVSQFRLANPCMRHDAEPDLMSVDAGRITWAGN